MRARRVRDGSLRRAHLLLPAAPLVLIVACAVGASSFTTLPTRAAAGVPERFVVPGPPPEDGSSAPRCASPMSDPRDGFVILLQRSGYLEASAGARFDRGSGTDPGARLVGDYRVEGGRYGVAPTELLRLDCRTGRAIGIVPR